MSDLSQESPLWREWAESRHSVQQMREELDSLRSENARLIGDHAAALRLVADIRAAIGDDGERMQPELVEYYKAVKRDAERYRWLRECGDEFDQLSVFDSRGCLIDECLDREIDAAMGGGNG